MRTARRNTEAVSTAGAMTADLVRQGRGSNWKGVLFAAFLWFSIVIALVTLASLLLHSIVQGWPRLDWNLIANMPSSLDRETSGMQSAIFGTLYVIGGLIITVVPVGVSAALYLEEYADPEKWHVRLIELNVQNLAAVPSIVFGILGLAFIVRDPLGLGFVPFAGSLTLAMLVLPTVILASRKAIRAVPDSIRQGSMALGATKWQTIWRQVLPSAIPGIITGTILAVSRAIGETAPLLLVGATVFVTYNPDGLFEGNYTVMPIQIFNWATRPQEEFRILAAAGIVLLMGVLIVLNSTAIWLRNKYTRDW